ncbi:hypothetical protein CLG85_008160 [Yangia mangrovi]|uniref:Uncharacterized protein n=1 Tax=Alloyangia mangrovi TaxID=1779329 RepID=A0A2A3K072_9RHOB|nr:hypothetical protein [Alloyangia mangrovi]MCA0941402.1 hypothetical protein [Alloyangia pacifica]MCA0946548.1 hypothetical protein [Alloyangia pacifica]MCT4370297.1 hypothetical protein [Alloyangia mangrovi]
MEMIADILLAAGALGAGFYCFVLSRRLTRFTDLEKGVGGAVAVLSAQVDDLTRTLEAAQQAAGKSGETLSDLTTRGEQVSHRLELLIASLHDLPEVAGDPGKGAGTSATAKAKLPEPEAETGYAEPVFLRHSRSGAA